MKTSLSRLYFLIITLFAFYGCERELTEFPLISFERCALENVTVNPFIVTDFECQSNVELSDVSVIRNPSETGINTSKFVGQYTDGASGTDALSIPFNGGLDLSTNALFNLKVKTGTTGTLLIELLGGSDGPLEFEIIVIGNETWTRYELDLIDQREENFTQINLIFNNETQNSGTDIYLLDDIKFDITIDPCEDVENDPLVVNDFDCQQNIFIGANPDQTSVPRVDNPFITGINLSANVGRYEDNGTEAFDNFLIDFGAPIDLSENALFKIKIYATIAGPLLIKLQGGTEEFEIQKNIVNLNQWVEYEFNLTDASENGNDEMVFFFNAGNTNGSASDVYLLDDLKFDVFIDPCEGVTPDLSIISDFDCQQNFMLGDINTRLTTIENIDPSGINTSDFIGEYIDDGTQPFDNFAIDFGMPIDLTENSLFKIKVNATIAGPILAKLEGGGTPLEIFQDIVVLNEWVEYTFDFSPAVGSGNERLTLFFNAGNDNGTPDDIYYIDDLRFDINDCPEIIEDCTGVTPNLSIISDFDCQQNYTFIDPNSAPIVQNPDVSCGNQSSNVGEYTDNGNDPFDFIGVNYDQSIDLSVTNELKLKVLSSVQAPLLAKLEGGQPVEINADITVVNEWIEYTFDFSAAQGNGNTRLILFFNAGVNDGAPQGVYYIDDIRFE